VVHMGAPDGAQRPEGGPMLHRIRNVWHPDRFHFAHRLRRGGGEFEGWYFKLVDARGEQPLAVIPGVFLGEGAHAFVQVLDGREARAWYHRYDLADFEAAPDRLDLRIGENRFSSDGVTLAIAADATDPDAAAHGTVRFSPWRPWPVTWASPGVMGPYGFVPFMECNHGILSVDHALEGAFEVCGRTVSYDGGRGYTEKDWGKRFPSAYVWTQSNHFDREGISLTASIARIPWLTGAFRGFLVGLLLDGELHRFTTHGGAVIESLTLSDTHLHLRIRNRDLRLEVDTRKESGGVLRAPYEQQMIERVAEAMTSDLDLRVTRLADHRLLYEGRGRHACLEMQGDLALILDG